MDLTKAITREGNLQCGIAEINICIDEEQNVLIISTPSPASAAALNSIKKLRLAITPSKFSPAGVTNGYARSFGLCCAPQKCELSLLSPSKQKSSGAPAIAIHIDGNNITPAQSIEILGVIFQADKKISQ